MSIGEKETAEISAGPKYLSEDQIVSLYHKAAAEKIEARNESILRDRDRQFISALCDFLLYGAVGFVLIEKYYAWLFLLLVPFLGRWIPIGPISLCHYIWNRKQARAYEDEEDPFATKRKDTKKEKLKKLYWLNRADGEETEDHVNPYSISVMRTVAEGLTTPLIASASMAEDRLAWQREGIEALLAQTDKLCEEIRSNRLRAGDLESVFDTRLNEARDTAKSLKHELQRIEKSIFNIRTEIGPLKAYIEKLKELEEATKQLAKIRGQMTRVLGVPADPVVQLEFQQLPARLETVRESLREINSSMQAYEDAVTELKQM